METRNPISLTAALSAVTNANKAHYLSNDEAWTLRMLVFQFFRPSGNIGEHADDELAKLYARDTVGDQPIEAEVIAMTTTDFRDMVIGPIIEDKSPPDYRVTVVHDDDAGPDFEEDKTIPVHVECSR